VELSDLLGDQPLALHGLAADWLFEDVKATWLYGYFTGTVLTAYAFCVQQLAGLVRMISDDPELSDEATTLEMLAEIAEQHAASTLTARSRPAAVALRLPGLPLGKPPRKRWARGDLNSVSRGFPQSTRVQEMHV